MAKIRVLTQLSALTFIERMRRSDARAAGHSRFSWQAEIFAGRNGFVDLGQVDGGDSCARRTEWKPAGRMRAPSIRYRACAGSAFAPMASPAHAVRAHGAVMGSCGTDGVRRFSCADSLVHRRAIA